MSLVDIYRSLIDHPSGHVYTATSIEGVNGVYIAANLIGQPSLLVKAETMSSDTPLRAAKVSFRPAQEFSISLDGETYQGFFYMLACESSDRVEIDSFLVLIQAFLAQQEGQQVTGENLRTFFQSMVKLFAVAPARDLDAERQGLWGELFFMRQFRGFKFWSPFWHSETHRTFDFSARDKRLEVKTTVGAQRVHQFSHRQIYALSDEEISIVSLLLREEDAGLSLRQLINEGREQFRRTSHYLKLEQAVRHAGMEDETMVGPAYDEAHAKSSLAWFRATDAPHFRLPEPPGVSETRYKVDLSTAPTMLGEDVRSWIETWVLSPVKSA